MPRLPQGLTIAYLERILERRRSELSTLTKERDRLQRQLAVIENKIRDQDGRSIGSLGTTRTGRARNPATLVETVAQVLGKSGKPMRIGEILESVVASGYRSNASNFRGVINLTLIKERKRFANISRGTYALKK
jgi:hypothetical protein